MLSLFGLRLYQGHYQIMYTLQRIPVYELPFVCFERRNNWIRHIFLPPVFCGKDSMYGNWTHLLKNCWLVHRNCLWDLGEPLRNRAIYLFILFLSMRLSFCRMAVKDGYFPGWVRYKKKDSTINFPQLVHSEYHNQSHSVHLWNKWQLWPTFRWTYQAYHIYFYKNLD